MIKISNLRHQKGAQPQYMIESTVPLPSALIGFRFCQRSTGDHQRRFAAGDLVSLLGDEGGEHTVNDRCRRPGRVSGTFHGAESATPLHLSSVHAAGVCPTF